MKCLMWKSEVLPIINPTFVLVLYNYKVRNQLHKLESICLNTEDINSYITVHNLKQLWSNDDDCKQLQR